MNKKENLKVAVIESCINGTMTIKVTAKRLGFSKRYVKELKARYKNSGTTFIIDTKEILHKKKIEVCISKRIGLKARFNDKWYKIIPISNSNNKSLKISQK